MNGAVETREGLMGSLEPGDIHVRALDRMVIVAIVFYFFCGINGVQGGGD